MFGSPRQFVDLPGRNREGLATTDAHLISKSLPCAAFATTLGEDTLLAFGNGQCPSQVVRRSDLWIEQDDMSGRLATGRELTLLDLEERLAVTVVTLPHDQRPGDLIAPLGYGAALANLHD